MNNPLAALNAAGVSIRPGDLVRERLVPENSVRTNHANLERVLTRIYEAGVDHNALPAGREDEGAAVSDNVWKALRKQLSARLSSCSAKAP